MSQHDPDHLIARLQGIQARVSSAAQDQKAALNAMEQLVIRVLELERKVKTLGPQAPEPYKPVSTLYAKAEHLYTLTAPFGYAKPEEVQEAREALRLALVKERGEG